MGPLIFNANRRSDTPGTLYKYVNHERALVCLPEVGDGTLRATQPAALNDPFECTVAVSSRRAEYDREFAVALTAINDKKPVTEQDVREARRQRSSAYLRDMLTCQVSTKYGVVSFSIDPLNLLMWSYYADGGAGFVIGYDKSKLDELADTENTLRPVEYVESPALLLAPADLASPINNLYSFLSTKSNKWSHEKEWRLIVQLSRTVGTGQKDPLGQHIALLRIPNEAVMSVYYAERTPPESVSLIESRLLDTNNRYGSGAPQKVILSSTAYKY